MAMMSAMEGVMVGNLRRLTLNKYLRIIKLFPGRINDIFNRKSINQSTSASANASKFK